MTGAASSTRDAQAGSRNLPLAGVRVLDMSRLAPGPYCTMLLADLGAEVIVVTGGRAGAPVSSFARGKRFVALDLKAEAGRAALHRLAATVDVFVESFRPGVCARLGAGYDELSRINPSLIYCSLTGYGQDGPLAQEAGHDINYLALTGILGAIGPHDRPPTAPLNMVADFAAGGLTAVIGVLAALFERISSGKGQHVDAAMIDGCMSLMAMHYPVWKQPVMPERGRGWLAGSAPYYRCYVCADGGYVAVGSLEPQFFAALWKDIGEGDPPDQMDTRLWPQIERTFAAAFASQPRDHWAKRYLGQDVCVFPVLSPDEVWQHPHIRARFPEAGPDNVPAIPRFSRTPVRQRALDQRDQSDAILMQAGLPPDRIALASPASERANTGWSGWPPRFKG
jgi:alpha-methylacyl-CoA racemase